MKYKLGISISAFIIFISLSGSNKKELIFPKPAKVSTNIYFDKSEIIVEDWAAFYSWTYLKKGKKKADLLLPDSNEVDPRVWKLFQTKADWYNSRRSMHTNKSIGYFKEICNDIIPYSKPELNPYTEPQCPFWDFPITGISYEQANSFCEWRTKQNGNSKVLYRLPSPLEWKEFAYKCLNFKERKIGLRDTLHRNGCAMFNYKFKSLCDNFEKFGVLEPKIRRIASFMPTNQNTHDVFGNVAEMTSIEGVAKGGSYFHTAKLSNIDSVLSYSKGQAWLGFRCLAEIKK